MVRIAEQQRMAIAARDERCIHMGVTWVRTKFGLHHAEATTAIAASKQRAGPARVAELQRSAKRANLSATLQEAEGRWPGVLEALRVDAHRRVAERYGVERSSMWWVRCRLHELSKLSGQTLEAVVRAVLNDIRCGPMRASR